jgi:hypothetical protein
MSKAAQKSAAESLAAPLSSGHLGHHPEASAAFLCAGKARHEHRQIIRSDERSLKACGLLRVFYVLATTRSPQWADPLRTALGKENLGQRVTEVLRPYRIELVEREGLEPSTPAL